MLMLEEATDGDSLRILHGLHPWKPLQVPDRLVPQVWGSGTSFSGGTLEF